MCFLRLQRWQELLHFLMKSSQVPVLLWKDCKDLNCDFVILWKIWQIFGINTFQHLFCEQFEPFILHCTTPKRRTRTELIRLLLLLLLLCSGGRKLAGLKCEVRIPSFQMGLKSNNHNMHLDLAHESSRLPKWPCRILN